MFRNYIRSNGILRQLMDKELRAYQHEHLGYLAAFLSKLHSKQAIEEIYDELNLLEIDEHWAIAQGNHLEQLFSNWLSSFAEYAVCAHAAGRFGHPHEAGSPVEDASLGRP